MREHGYEPVFYGAVTVGERGQVVIPQKARQEQGIHPGDKMLVLGAGFAGHGLMMIKAKAVGALLAKLSEHANALERLMRLSAAADQEGSGSVDADDSAGREEQAENRAPVVAREDER